MQQIMKYKRSREPSLKEKNRLQITSIFIENITTEPMD